MDHAANIASQSVSQPARSRLTNSKQYKNKNDEDENRKSRHRNPLLSKNGSMASSNADAR